MGKATTHESVEKPCARPPAMTLGEWQRLVHDALYAVQVSGSGETFQGTLRSRRVDQLSVCQISAGAQTVRCRRANVHWRSRFLDIVHVRDGVLDLDHCGMSASISGGDSIVLDRAKGFVSRNGPMSGVIIGIPMAWFATDPIDIGAIAGRPIPGASGWGRLLAQVIDQICEDMDVVIELPHYQIADLLKALLLIASRLPARSAQPGKRRLVEDASVLIRSAAQDPEANPAAIARKLGVSLRLLQMAFSAERRSVARDLLEARLGHALAMLADPRFDSLSVAEVSYRSGFSDASHFGKRFRERFGFSPGRARVLREETRFPALIDYA